MVSSCCGSICSDQGCGQGLCQETCCHPSCCQTTCCHRSCRTSSCCVSSCCYPLMLQFQLLCPQLWSVQLLLPSLLPDCLVSPNITDFLVVELHSSPQPWVNHQYSCIFIFFFISFVHSIWTGSDLSLCLSIPSIVPPRNCSKISSLNWVPQRLSRFCACYLDIPADDQMSTLVPGDRLLIPWLLCMTWPLQWVLCDGTTTCP